MPTGERPTPRESLAEVLRPIGEHLAAQMMQGEGLRERKKRLKRQQISDTATMLFIERGFDAVRVSDVASACDVSEKTVYNYFPTKESLLFDRTDEIAAQMSTALREREPDKSPITVALEILEGDLSRMTGYWAEAPDQKAAIQLVRRFAELVEATPALRAAQHDMFEHLIDVAASALADQAGVNPEDPEPIITATAMVGLWRVQFGSLLRFADGTLDAATVTKRVTADVRRAARLIDTGLWSFSVAVQGNAGRQQLRDAADAANEARKQVTIAIKQAKEAWQAVKTDVKQQHRATQQERRAEQQRLRRTAQREQHRKRNR